MGDRCSISVMFGGKITRAQAQEMVKLGDDYDLYPNNEVPSSALSADNIADGWQGDDINYGTVNQLTEFCTQKKIPYMLWNGTGGSYTSGVEKFDGTRKTYCDCNDSWEPLVAYAEILKADALKSGLAKIIADAKFWEKSLPPVEIVD